MCCEKATALLNIQQAEFLDLPQVNFKIV